MYVLVSLMVGLAWFYYLSLPLIWPACAAIKWHWRSAQGPSSRLKNRRDQITAAGGNVFCAIMIGVLILRAAVYVQAYFSQGYVIGR